jgi:phage virion morphogenesis protein
MAGASFILDDASVDAALRRAAAAGANTAALMDAFASQMLYGVQRRFETETAPDGRPWTPLKPQTLRRRPKGRSNRGGTGAILRDTNLLYSSIAPTSTAVEAAVGTNLVYAAIHQLGGPIQRYARSTTIRLRKVGGRTRFAKRSHKKATERRVEIGEYSITIPARPYLGFSESDRIALLELAEEHFRAAIEGRTP